MYSGKGHKSTCSACMSCCYMRHLFQHDHHKKCVRNNQSPGPGCCPWNGATTICLPSDCKSLVLVNFLFVHVQVPICVQNPSDDSWHLVHWIDSKACFGDDRTHSQQLDGQYRTYTNRYGPGLVIYWFGFVDGLENDADVMILERFPRGPELMQLPRLTAKANLTSVADTGSTSHCCPVLP